MFSVLKFFYKITPNNTAGSSNSFQRTSKRIHVPTSYREYVNTLNTERQTFNCDDIENTIEDDQEWGFFVDMDAVPNIIIRQKKTPPIKIEYSYYKYVAKYTYFRSNKIVYEDKKYSSFDSFDDIVCLDDENPPALVVVPSSCYLYEEILKIIRQSASRHSRGRASRWYYKITLIVMLVITGMSCAAFIACLALI